MLDSIEPRQFDEWIAYRQIEPDPAARLFEMLKRGFTSASWGKVEPDLFDPVNDKRSDEPAAVTPAQASQLLAQAIGAQHGHRDR